MLDYVRVISFLLFIIIIVINFWLCALWSLSFILSKNKLHTDRRTCVLCLLRPELDFFAIL